MHLPPRLVEHCREWEDVVETNWFELLVWGTATLSGLATIVQFARNPFFITDDSALFQHAGWYIGQGATLYVDIWDLKPPLIYAVTTVLAFLSGGNMAALHVLSVVVATGTVAGGIVLVGVLTHRLTDDGIASLAAAGTMFVVPSVYAFPAAGIRPKYFAFLFAVAALLLAVDDRPMASGAAAAVCAGFWQLGGAIAILVVGVGWHRHSRAGLARTILGGLVVTAAVVLPFVLAGLSVPLFVEVLLAPIYGVEQYTLPGRLLEFVLELGYSVLLVPIGAYGWWRAIAANYDRYWWVGAGGTIYVLQIFLELQGAIEAILLLLFLALGVGLLVARVEPPQRSFVIVLVLLLAVSSLYWESGLYDPAREAVETAHRAHSIPTYDELPADPEGVPSMQTIYWEKLKPETCHYRLGDKQKYFEHVTGGSLTKSECGQWPFGQPPAAWFLEKIR